VTVGGEDRVRGWPVRYRKLELKKLYVVSWMRSKEVVILVWLGGIMQHVVCRI
jgi:hypothetical protein